MPTKKASSAPAKRKSKTSAETLPSPDQLKDGKHEYYIGNWSYYKSVEDVSQISAALLAAHTQADRRVAALPRVNVLLLPPTAAAARAERDDGEGGATQPPIHIELADNMHLEGVSRRTLVESEALVKDWKRNPVAAAEAVAEADKDAAADGEPEAAPTSPQEEEEGLASPAADPLPVYEPTEVDRLEAIPVTYGADFSARHACVAGPVSLEGVLPQMIVDPTLPNRPADDAATLEALSASRKVSVLKDKKGKKSKKAPKLTPEELEELEQKRAEAEAEFQRLTEEAVQKAKEQEDYLMTFAHPDRWAKVVVTNITFTGPVVVRRAHVTFQNCAFTSPADAVAQLTVSQYCRVSCTKCAFDAPVTAGVYALPTSQLEVSKCLFSGVPQVTVALAQQEATAAAAAAAAATQDANGPSPRPAADDEEDDGDGDDAGEQANSNSGAAGAQEAAVLPAAVLATSVTAEQARRGAVGVHGDAARVQIANSEFVFLGTGVVLRGRFQPAARMPVLKGLPKSTAALAVQDNMFHYLFSTGILVDDSARDVLIQRNHTADCAYYALDCHGGAKSVSVYRNNFSTNSVVRIRKGCQPQFLENQLAAIPVDDNSCDNPAMASVY